MLFIFNQHLLELQTVIGASWNNSDVFLQLSCFSQKVYLWIVSEALEATNCYMLITCSGYQVFSITILSKTTSILILSQAQSEKKGKMYPLILFHFNLMILVTNTFSSPQTGFEWKKSRKCKGGLMCFLYKSTMSHVTRYSKQPWKLFLRTMACTIPVTWINNKLCLWARNIPQPQQHHPSQKGHDEDRITACLPRQHQQAESACYRSVLHLLPCVCSYIIDLWC